MTSTTSSAPTSKPPSPSSTRLRTAAWKARCSSPRHSGTSSAGPAARRTERRHWCSHRSFLQVTGPPFGKAGWTSATHPLGRIRILARHPVPSAARFPRRPDSQRSAGRGWTAATIPARRGKRHPPARPPGALPRRGRTARCHPPRAVYAGKLQIRGTGCKADSSTEDQKLYGGNSDRRGRRPSLSFMSYRPSGGAFLGDLPDCRPRPARQPYRLRLLCPMEHPEPHLLARLHQAGLFERTGTQAGGEELGWPGLVTLHPDDGWARRRQTGKSCLPTVTGPCSWTKCARTSSPRLERPLRRYRGDGGDPDDDAPVGKAPCSSVTKRGINREERRSRNGPGV